MMKTAFPFQKLFQKLLFFSLPFSLVVQNVGLNTNGLKLPVGITVIVEKWRIQLWTHGWFLTPVVRYARENSNLLVVINVCCFVIQVNLWHLVVVWPVSVKLLHAYTQNLLTVLKILTSKADVVKAAFAEWPLARHSFSCT